MDPRVVALAEQVVTHPPGLIRDGLVLKLAITIQNAIEYWIAEMERPA